MNPRRTPLVVLAPLVVALAGCELSDDVTGPPQDETEVVADAVALEVVVGDDHFAPDTGEVSVGDTVVWDFTTASRPHNVVFTHVSSDILEDGMWAHTFTEPGTYPYECTLHADMAGQITVTG